MDENSNNTSSTIGNNSSNQEEKPQPKPQVVERPNTNTAIETHSDNNTDYETKKK